MKLMLRNNIIVETDDDHEGFVIVVNIPSHYTGGWYKGVRACLYYGGARSPLEWHGGSFGKDYDVIMEVKEIEYEM